MARMPSPARRDPGATGRVCRCALLAALAVAVAAAEAFVPVPAPVPGMKLGLANTVTVVAAFWLGPAEAAAVLGVRIVLCAVLAGQLAALPFSLAGGACALVVTLIFARLGMRGKVRLCCMTAAVAHNCAQIAVAAALTATPQIAVYLPILLVAGTATGYATGTLAEAVLDRLPSPLPFATKGTEHPEAGSDGANEPPKAMPAATLGAPSACRQTEANAPHPAGSAPPAEQPRHA